MARRGQRTIDLDRLVHLLQAHLTPILTPPGYPQKSRMNRKCFGRRFFADEGRCLRLRAAL